MSLKFTVRTAMPLEVRADLAIIGVFAHAKAKPGHLSADLKAVDVASSGVLAKLALRDEFAAKRDQTLSVSTAGKGAADRTIVIGLGDPDKLTDGDVRTFAAKASKLAQSEKAKSLVLGLPAGLEPRIRVISEGVALGVYRFTKYLTGDRKPKSALAEVTLALPGKLPASAKQQGELGQKIAEAVNHARDLSNEPGNMMTPAHLAAEAAKLCRTHKFKTVIYDHKQLLQKGMKLIDAVGRGSVNGPTFVHMAYVPAKKSKRLVFVGKGVTFDSGGISIKPGPGMGEMKHDMSGAANMVGLMGAIAALKPNVEVHCIFGAAENMPDGNAYRPGDIWGSLDGKTVEMLNTDAEGRLVLADCLAYARNLKPDMLVDNATLTGACVVALGTTCSAFYASDDATAEKFGSAVKSSGESMWHMPLLDDLREQIKSEVADVRQLGDRSGGSITAALFLKEFIGDTKSWVHVDIAGPAMAERAFAWNPTKGGTGHGVLTFLSLIEQAAAGK